MKLVTLKLTTKELEVLTTLVGRSALSQRVHRPENARLQIQCRRDESWQDIDRAPSIHAGPCFCEEDYNSEDQTAPPVE